MPLRNHRLYHIIVYNNHLQSTKIHCFRSFLTRQTVVVFDPPCSALRGPVIRFVFNSSFSVRRVANHRRVTPGTQPSCLCRRPCNEAPRRRPHQTRKRNRFGSKITAIRDIDEKRYILMARYCLMFHRQSGRFSYSFDRRGDCGVNCFIKH